MAIVEELKEFEREGGDQEHQVNFLKKLLIELAFVVVHVYVVSDCRYAWH